MKKVLIITHGFPGEGARGNIKLIKYLPNFGYIPIVITNKVRDNKYEKKVIANEFNNNIRFYKSFSFNRSPFRVFSKFFNSWELTIYYEKFFFIPDFYINWVPSAFIRAKKIIDIENIHCIITASPPESTHITGMLLKRYTKTKWIADFRDLWTTKEIVNKSPSRMHDHVLKYIEKTIYRKCDHIIANTHKNRDIYLKDFCIPNDKITVITNGYDPDECCRFNNELLKSRNSVFSIGYMGNFDKEGFPWQNFLNAIKEIILGNKDIIIRINICGYISKNAKDFIKKWALESVVRMHGTLPHFEAFKNTQNNDLLLLFLYETKYSKAIVPHKLYHYLSMNKPVFAIAEEDGEVAHIIRKTNVGIVVSKKKNAVMKQLLLQFYREWFERGYIRYEPNRTEIEKYDVVKLTKKLALLLDTY
jgi:glycosyltransferase involved in cell wall biosynthesis